MNGDVTSRKIGDSVRTIFATVRLSETVGGENVSDKSNFSDE